MDEEKIREHARALMLNHPEIKPKINNMVLDIELSESNKVRAQFGLLPWSLKEYKRYKRTQYNE